MPVFITSDGAHLHYDLIGDGPPMVPTPGGREGRRVLAALAAELAQHFHLLTWDRRNTGDSDLHFDETRSEQAIWATDLAELTHGLNLAPAWIAGGPAGCRVSLKAVLHDPSIARGLVLWSASGGAYGSQFLGFNYHVPYIMAAQSGGMAAVARTPFFAERIVGNERNRDYLLSFDADRFIAVMKRWNESFYPREGEPLAGIEGDLGVINVPTLIIERNDDIHPASASQALEMAMPGAKLAPSPWNGEAFMAYLTGKVPGTVFDLYPQLGPQILAFTT